MDEYRLSCSCLFQLLLAKGAIINEMRELINLSLRNFIGLASAHGIEEIGVVLGRLDLVEQEFHG